MYVYPFNITHKLTSISRGFAVVLVRDEHRDPYYKFAGTVEFVRNRWVATFDLLNGSGPRKLSSYPRRDEAVAAIVREYNGFVSAKFQAEQDYKMLMETIEKINLEDSMKND